MKKKWFHIVIDSTAFESADYLIRFLSDEEFETCKEFNSFYNVNDATIEIFELESTGNKKRREDIEKKLYQFKEED